MVYGLASGCLLLGGVGLATMPATTRQGVNFQVSVRSVPLYVKAVAFLHRHFQCALLAGQITQGRGSDLARALAVFEWTRQHIRPTPAGWPVVDDHILDIIIRGYGLDDQMADVFTMLATYAGVPAFWRVAKVSGGRLVLAFARVDGRWTVWDVAHGLAFREADGRLADVHALIADPALVRATAGSLAPDGVPYDRYVAQLQPFQAPAMLRAEQQMLWPRVWFEVRRAIGRTESS